MKAWLDLLREVLHTGESRDDRTGVGTLALFGKQITVNNQRSFPAVTTKLLGFRQVAAELAAFLQGADNLEQFHKVVCTIWDANGAAPYWLPRARLRAARRRDTARCRADRSSTTSHHRLRS